jgi:hypothetical protein
VTQHKLIVEVALTFYAESKNHRAECINRDLGRHQTTTWQRHRADRACPHNDARQVLLWRLSSWRACGAIRSLARSRIAHPAIGRRLLRAPVTVIAKADIALHDIDQKKLVAPLLLYPALL